MVLLIKVCVSCKKEKKEDGFIHAICFCTYTLKYVFYITDYFLLIHTKKYLQTDELDTRLKAVGLVGDLFSLPGSSISEVFQPVFSEFLKRLTDRIVEVRMSVLVHVKSCLLSNPLRDEASEIICEYHNLYIFFLYP